MHDKRGRTGGLGEGASLRRNDRRWSRAEARAPWLPQYLDQRLRLQNRKRERERISLRIVLG